MLFGSGRAIPVLGSGILVCLCHIADDALKRLDQGHLCRPYTPREVT